MTSSISRRKFLKQSALAGTGFWVAGGLEGAPLRQPGPNERVNVAGVGVGGRGSADINAVAKFANIVALCDVDDTRAGQTYNAFPKAARYSDFRLMLDKQRDIDAVIVATPDHCHAQVVVTAMRRGKHVYCEKPLCHDIWEARLIKEVAQRNKVATQMGNHGTAANGFRRGVEVIQSGALGEVREVHVWTNRPIWPQNMNRPTGTTPVPKTLHWDLWLGPAAERPYYNQQNGQYGTYLPFNWRGWWDFGTGALGDMACHTMNLPYMGLKLGVPSSVIAELSTPLNPDSGPEGCKITYEFPARGKLPPVTLYWYERRQPTAKVLGTLNLKAGGMGGMGAASGCLIIGSNGKGMYSSNDYGQTQQLLPDEAFKGYKDPEPTLPRSPGHHREWIDAIRGARPAMSNFVDYAARLTETVLLGIVAMRAGCSEPNVLGKRVVWDAEKMQAVDMPEADRFIRVPRRAGWDL